MTKQIGSVWRNLDFWIKLIATGLGLIMTIRVVLINPMIQSEVSKVSQYNSICSQIEIMKVDMRYMKENMERIYKKVEKL